MQSWLGVTLVQGAWAAGTVLARRLASWWRAIQLLFPVLLLCRRRRRAGPAAGCSWPSSCSCCCCTGRPSAPRCRTTRPGRRVWEEVARRLPPDRPLRIVDIGSGLGGLVLDLARRRPDCDAQRHRAGAAALAGQPPARAGLGAQPRPFPARRLRKRLDFGNYDVVFAYLSPAAMGGLWRKAAAEMRPGQCFSVTNLPSPSGSPMSAL
jgi:hypothetical protein